MGRMSIDSCRAAVQAQGDGAVKTSRMAFAQPSADAELPATLFDNPTAADLGALVLLPEGLLDGPAAAQVVGAPPAIEACRTGLFLTSLGIE